MKIDVLSQNTLKLTLSKLDMFDLDIKYESLSGKNPETKRLLAHVIKSIQSDKQVSFDFSGERLFIEAFPRIDGGCMLYISCLEEETARDVKKSRRGKQMSEQTDKGGRTGRSALWKAPSSETSESDLTFFSSETDLTVNNLSLFKKAEYNKPANTVLICELQSAAELGKLCRILCNTVRPAHGLNTALYFSGDVYRLAVTCDNISFVRGLMNEFGAVLSGDDCLAVTEEYFGLLAENDAVELISRCF